MTVERRKHERHPSNAVQAVIITHRGCLVGSLANVSEEGLFVGGEGRGLEGAKVRIRLFYPQGAIDVVGTVVRNDLECGFAVKVEATRRQERPSRPWKVIPLRLQPAMTAAASLF